MQILQATKISAKTPERLQQPKPLPSLIFNQLGWCRETQRSYTQALLYTSIKIHPRDQGKPETEMCKLLIGIFGFARSNLHTRSCRLHLTLWKKKRKRKQQKKSLSSKVHSRPEWRQTLHLQPRVRWVGGEGGVGVGGSGMFPSTCGSWDNLTGKAGLSLAVKRNNYRVHMRDKRRAQLQLIFLARR